MLDTGHATGQIGLFAEFEPDNRPDNRANKAILNRTGHPVPRAGVVSPEGGATPQAGPRAGEANPSRSDRITETFLILATEQNDDQSDGWQFRAFADDHRAGSPLLSRAIRLVDAPNQNHA